MIDFTQYPELIKYYKVSKKMFDKAMKLKDKKKPTQNDYDTANSILIEQEKYKLTVLAKEVFNILIEINPNVYEYKTGTFHTFKEIYGEDFSQIHDKDILSIIAMYITIDSLTYSHCDSVKTIDGKSIIPRDFNQCKSYQPGDESPIWRSGRVVDYGFRVGIPTNFFRKFSNAQKEKQIDLWYDMTLEQKQEWMDKQLWKSVIEKYHIQ